jgi:hypothetical protein
MGTCEVMHETHLSMLFKERDPEREQRLAREAEDQLRLKKVRHTASLNVICYLSTYFLLLTFCTFIWDG